MSAGLWAAVGPAPRRRDGLSAVPAPPAPISTSIEPRDVSQALRPARARWRASRSTFRAGEIVGAVRPERRRQVHASRRALHAGAADRRRRALRRPDGAPSWATRCAARIGVLGHDLFLYGDLTARENLEFFGRLYGVADLDARVDAALGGRAARGSRRRPRRRRSRAACGSAWRSSARCCTIRGWCCSTSRSPGSTTSRRRCCRRGCAISAPQGAIVVMATHDFDTADGLVDARGLLPRRARRASSSRGRSRCASATAARCAEAWRDRRASAPPGSSRARICVVEARSRELVYTTLFFAVVVRARVRVRVRPRGPAGRERRRPASSGWRSRSPARWRSAARSSASVRPRRCARCSSRRSSARAVYLGKLVALLVLLVAVEIVLVPIVGAVLSARRSGRAPWLLLGLLAAGHGRLRGGRDAVRGDARARAVARRAAAGRAVSDDGAGRSSPACRARRRSSPPSRTRRWPQTWLAMLVFFDAVFVTLALWTFAPVMTSRHACDCRTRLVPVLLGVAAVMFAAAPFVIDTAPYESTMGLVQRIFYFHVPAALTMLLSAIVCGVASARYLWRRTPRGGSRRARRRGAGRRVRHDRAGDRAALGAQGLGRLVGLGAAPHQHARDVDGVRGVPPAAPVRRRRDPRCWRRPSASSAWRSCRSSTGR